MRKNCPKDLGPRSLRQRLGKNTFAPLILRHKCFWRTRQVISQELRMKIGHLIRIRVTSLTAVQKGRKMRQEEGCV